MNLQVSTWTAACVFQPSIQIIELNLEVINVMLPVDMMLHSVLYYFILLFWKLLERPTINHIIQHCFLCSQRLKMTSFSSKYLAAQLDRRTLLSNNCVEADVDFTYTLRWALQRCVLSGHSESPNKQIRCFSTIAFLILGRFNLLAFRFVF